MNSENKQFEKGLLLMGDHDSGKTIITEFIEGLLPNQVFHLNGRTKDLFENHFLFSDLTEHHKVIVIEDVIFLDTIIATFNYINQTITVRRQMKEDIEVLCPKIIITTTLRLELPPSLSRRFHIVILSTRGDNSFYTKKQKVH
jgi:archaellum biogenesis ATPase FlaH